jgi:hypothetical protein
VRRTVVDFDPSVPRVEGVVIEFYPSAESVDAYSNGETVKDDF